MTLVVSIYFNIGITLKEKSEKFESLKTKSTSQSLSAPMSNSGHHHHVLNSQQQSRPTVLSSSPRQRSHTTGAMPPSSASASQRDLVVDASNPIDLNYAHMLLYINCNNCRVQSLTHSHTSSKLVIATSFANSAYDHVRTMFVLRSIEHLFLECDREFLNAVATTSITANPSLFGNNAFFGSWQRSRAPVFSVHNEKFLDLISRHIKTIYGASFYSQSQNSNSNASAPPNLATSQSSNAYASLNLNNTTYLEVIFLFI